MMNNSGLSEPKKQAIVIITETMIDAMITYLKTKEFRYYPLIPTITTMATENPDYLFSFQYLGKGRAFLSQTGELYQERIAISLGKLGKIWSINPTYRKDESKTRKHLTEFHTLQVTQTYASLDDAISLNENLFYEGFKAVIGQNREQLDILNRDVTKINIEPPYKRISYDEAIKIYNNIVKQFETEEDKKKEIKWGENFDSEQEDWLCEFFGVPFSIKHQPTKIRPFYMNPNPNNMEVTDSYDTFVPIAGEVSTGCIPIKDPDLLLKNLQERNLPLFPYQWYIDLKKHYPIDTISFGIGIERMLMYITGCKNISEITPYPRVSDSPPYP